MNINSSMFPFSSIFEHSFLLYKADMMLVEGIWNVQLLWVTVYVCVTVNGIRNC